MHNLSKALILMFIPLCCSYSQSLGDKNIIEKIISDNTAIEGKLLICEKGFIIDEKDSADVLIEYMQKCDKRLLDKLAGIIISSELCHQNIDYLNQIKDCLEKRLAEFKDDADATYKIFEVLEDLQDRTNQDSSPPKIQDSSELFLKCLSQLDKQNKNQFVDKSINSGIFLPLFFTFEEKYSLILSECLGSGVSSLHNTILQFLLDNYFLIANRELVSGIVRLTSSDDKILRDKARYLMYELFPFACSEAVKHTFEWDKWWAANANHFPFTNHSQEVLLDKKASEKARLAVLSKLRDLSPSVTNTLLKISLDHSDNINVRSGCLAILISHVHQSKQNQTSDDTNAKRILDAINNILDPAFKENALLVPRILNMLATFSVTNHKLDNTMRDLLSNKNIDDSIKGKICTVLANSKLSKKLNATKCLTYYQDVPDNQPKLKEQVLYALMTLTGKNEAFNKKTATFIETLDFWRKAVSSMPDDPPEEGGN